MIWYVEENFRIDELLCCFDVKVRVCKAIRKNVQVLMAEKKIGADRLRPSPFQKILQSQKMSKSKNWRGQV